MQIIKEYEGTLEEESILSGEETERYLFTIYRAIIALIITLLALKVMLHLFKMVDRIVRRSYYMIHHKKMRDKITSGSGDAKKKSNAKII